MSRLSVFHLLLSGAVAVAAWSAPSLAAPPTQPAVPSDTTAAVTQSASAEVFRPAPLPDENASTPTRVASNDEPDLHPDLLTMHDHSSGVLGDTSAEYGHEQRVRPAGGMSLSIPMQ